MLHLFGLSVFGLLMGGMLWANSRRWRYLAAAYAGAPDKAIERRKLQNAVLIDGSGFNALSGTVTMGLHEAGISFRIILPFSLFHEPIFVPYGDIRGWRTLWYLDAPSTELAFRRAPDVKMIVPFEQAKWLQTYSADRMELREVDPPQGRTGRGWFTFNLMHLILVVVMMVGWGIQLLLR